MRKTKLLRAFCLCMAVMLSSLCVFPSFASYPSNVNTEKVAAFLRQETAVEGVLNGDACYIIDIPDGAGTNFGGSYEGDADTPLVGYNTNGSGVYFALSFSIWVYGQSETPIGTICWDDWNWPVRPDLYGPLDLAGTTFTHIENLHRNTTHITSICIDDCRNMQWVDISAQTFCKEFSAVNCPQLNRITANDMALTDIAVQPDAFTEPLYADVFGRGVITKVNYNEIGRNELALGAEVINKNFLGWFVDGVRVCEFPRYVVYDGGSATACFGGDANGDGNVSIADAVIALRLALMGGGENDLAMLDIDGNGGIDVADAILIARFTLGL